ncbi:MAG TPA: nitrate reductase [Pirellulales bacterium]|jgi:assimilatory nitrate reductase catalytic subunit|nr:nitrate reductase [Pirellulales bacterium]
MTTIAKSLHRLVRRAGNLMRQKEGPLTSDLLRNPGGFGLGQVPAAKTPDATTNMVCGYCSTGCGLTIHLREGSAVNLSPATEYPVNLGMACPKGWEALRVLDAPDRATTPLLRDARGKLQPTDWDTALREMCGQFQAIQAKHGPEAVAWLGTGQITTEELAYLGSLAKFGMGMVHGDGNTRQCMATAVVAYKQSFGFDAPPYTYQDFEQSDVIVLVGSNLCIAHPIMWERICRNPFQPEIVVIDPRKTETAMAATLHLPIAPKSDLTLLYGIAQRLIHHDWIDRAYIDRHTNDFEEFKAFVQSFTPSRVAQATGLPEATLERFAELIHQGKRVSFWWTMGVNQSYEGVRTAQALINLALMTGNIGRPGTGANSITGQCNAMGSRLFSNTTGLLGGRDFTKPDDRRAVAEILHLDDSRIPTQNSLAYHEIMEAILAGKIRGLWVVATNSAHSWINQDAARDILGRLEFLVVQEMYASTETAAHAHLVLPAAGWGEKDGTLINSERRIGLIKKVVKAPGEALADFAIFRLVSHYWGCEDLFRQWNSPEAVFQILKELSRGQPCDFSGIRDYEQLDELGGIQWPFPSGTTSAETERRLFADGKFFHPDRRARFIFESVRTMPELPSEAYPLILLTGRGTASQWHTQTRTKKSPVLRKLYPNDIYVEINPEDARRANIRPGQTIIVESQRGTIKARAFVTPTIRPGQVFIPMHYEDANRLTLAHFDPYSKQPSYKNCAVRIRQVEAADA